MADRTIRNNNNNNNNNNCTNDNNNNNKETKKLIENFDLHCMLIAIRRHHYSGKEELRCSSAGSVRFSSSHWEKICQHDTIRINLFNSIRNWHDVNVEMIGEWQQNRKSSTYISTPQQHYWERNSHSHYSNKPKHRDCHHHHYHRRLHPQANKIMIFDCDRSEAEEQKQKVTTALSALVSSLELSSSSTLMLSTLSSVALASTVAILGDSLLLLPADDSLLRYCQCKRQNNRQQQQQQKSVMLSKKFEMKFLPDAIQQYHHHQRCFIIVAKLSDETDENDLISCHKCILLDEFNDHHHHHRHSNDIETIEKQKPSKMVKSHRSSSRQQHRQRHLEKFTFFVYLIKWKNCLIPMPSSPSPLALCRTLPRLSQTETFDFLRTTENDDIIGIDENCHKRRSQPNIGVLWRHCRYPNRANAPSASIFLCCHPDSLHYLLSQQFNYIKLWSLAVVLFNHQNNMKEPPSSLLPSSEMTLLWLVSKLSEDIESERQTPAVVVEIRQTVEDYSSSTPKSIDLRCWLFDMPSSMAKIILPALNTATAPYLYYCYYYRSCCCCSSCCCLGKIKQNYVVMKSFNDRINCYTDADRLDSINYSYANANANTNEIRDSSIDNNNCVSTEQEASGSRGRSWQLDDSNKRNKIINLNHQQHLIMVILMRLLVLFTAISSMKSKVLPSITDALSQFSNDNMQSTFANDLAAITTTILCCNLNISVGIFSIFAFINVVNVVAISIAALFGGRFDITKTYVVVANSTSNRHCNGSGSINSSSRRTNTSLMNVICLIKQWLWLCLSIIKFNNVNSNRQQTDIAVNRSRTVEIKSDVNENRIENKNNVNAVESETKVILCRRKQISKNSEWNNRAFIGCFMMALIVGFSNAARPEVPTNCTFPQRWEGSWFLSGYQHSIHIKDSLFSYRGKCMASDGNKYLIVDEKGCHRCLVIYEKHTNVLQYKESECDGDSYYMDQTNINNPAAMPIRSIINSDRVGGGAHPNSRFSSLDPCTGSYDDPSYCKGREILQNLCDQIPGDALLFSLFREEAEPVKCPLRGPYTFTYNRGHGECKSPVSNIDSCTEESRLLLSFQACPDVHGTESTVEELTCMATWKDGNSRYLVGLVSHHHAITNEDRFRCFVYEKISTMIGFAHLGAFSGQLNPNLKDAEYKLAQSGDATCNGLDSAEVGSRIMTLRKPSPAERCDFPAWLKGPRHWYSLKGNFGYQFHSSDGSMHITKPTGFTDTRAYCEQINKQTMSEMQAVVHFTSGCKKGFMCMTFYRRDINIAEIQMGQAASRLEDACLPDHFDVARMSYVTLLASNSEASKCPTDGLYHLLGAIGPPNVVSRHKRNHNNNNNNHYSNNMYDRDMKRQQHNPHGHHHRTNKHQHHNHHQHYYNNNNRNNNNNQELNGHKRETLFEQHTNQTQIIIGEKDAETAKQQQNKGGTNIAKRNRRYIEEDNEINLQRTYSNHNNATSSGITNDNNSRNIYMEGKNEFHQNHSVSATTNQYKYAITNDPSPDEKMKQSFHHSSTASNSDNDNNYMSLESSTFEGPNATTTNDYESLHFYGPENRPAMNDSTLHSVIEADDTHLINDSEKPTKIKKNHSKHCKNAQHKHHKQKKTSSHNNHHHHRQHNENHQPEESDKNHNHKLKSKNHVHHTHHLMKTNHNNHLHDQHQGNHHHQHHQSHHQGNAIVERKSIEVFTSINEFQQSQRSRRDAPGCTVNYKSQRQLRIGCSDLNQIDVRPQCNDENEVYICYGSWTENLNTYILAKHVGTQHLICLTYIPFMGNEAKLVIGDECYHHSHIQADRLIMTNITRFGQCGDSSSAMHRNPSKLLLFLGPLIVIFVMHLMSLTEIR